MSKKNIQSTNARRIDDNTFALDLNELLEKKNGVSQFQKLNHVMNLSKRVGSNALLPENYIRECGKQFYDFVVAGDAAELISFKAEFAGMFGIELIYEGFEDVFGVAEDKVAPKALGEEHTHVDQAEEVELAADSTKATNDALKFFAAYNDDDVKTCQKIAKKYGLTLEQLLAVVPGKYNTDEEKIVNVLDSTDLADIFTAMIDNGQKKGSKLMKKLVRNYYRKEMYIPNAKLGKTYCAVSNGLYRAGEKIKNDALDAKTWFEMKAKKVGNKIKQAIAWVKESFRDLGLRIESKRKARKVRKNVEANVNNITANAATYAC